MTKGWPYFVWTGLLASVLATPVVVLLASQEPAACLRESPFSLTEVEELVKNPGIPDNFTRLQVESCGVDFILDVESAGRLRALGAGETLVAMLIPPENPAPGTTWTPPIDRREMLWIPPGTFLMGSPTAEPGRDSDEAQHSVELERGLWLDVGEVTNESYRRFIVAMPEWQKETIDARYHDGNYLKDWDGIDFPDGTGNDPVVYVSWYAARAYAAWAGKRLPTEAEWEHAARAGTTSYYWWREEFDATRVQAARSASDLDPARQSPWGLFDMIGGAWEWTSTLYSTYPYPYQQSDGRENPDTAGARVVRGGYWMSSPSFLRAANRHFENPELTRDILGIRCAR